MPVIKLFGFSGCTFFTSAVDDDATKTIQRNTVLYALFYTHGAARGISAQLNISPHYRFMVQNQTTVSLCLTIAI